MIRTEDEVRNTADRILGFSDAEQKVRQGTGQITTFNQLGFSSVNDKPDGWYLPVQANQVAIILETKASDVDITKKEYVPLFVAVKGYKQNIQRDQKQAKRWSIAESCS